MLNEDYSQPFYMDNRMRKRIYGRDWDKANPYLPALEPKADDSISGNLVYLDKKDISIILDKVPRYPSSPPPRDEGGVIGGGDSDFKQLERLVLHLQLKLNEHIDQARRRSKGGF